MLRSSSLTIGVLLLFACQHAPEPTTYLAAAAQASQRGPLDVVRLLARWDTAGKTLSYGDDADYDSARDFLICWLPSEQCQTDEPGWDSHSVVSGYTMRLVRQDGDSALVEVKYDKVADWSGASHYVVDQQPIRWTVHLERTDARWRVVDPESQKEPFISRDAALRLMARTRSDTMAVLSERP